MEGRGTISGSNPSEDATNSARVPSSHPVGEESLRPVPRIVAALDEAPSIARVVEMTVKAIRDRYREAPVKHRRRIGVSKVGGTLKGSLKVDRAERAELSVGWAETTFDVDELEDLEYLKRLVEGRTDLAATRAALEILGLYGNRGRGAAPPTGSTAEQRREPLGEEPV